MEAIESGIKYGLRTIFSGGSVDKKLLHDEILMEQEAKKLQIKFEEFVDFFAYRDNRGRSRNKIVDLFSGGAKDQGFLIQQLDQYYSEYQKAKEEESKKKSAGAKELINNFSNTAEGTYTWNGSEWIRQ